MRYSDFIVPDFSLISYFKLNHSYRVWTSSNFIYFKPQESQYIKNINRNWKARLSVHAEDLHQAWDIILPLLIQNKIPFKVGREDYFHTQSEIRKQQLAETQSEYEKFRKLGTYSTEFLSDELTCISTVILALSLSNSWLVCKFQQLLARITLFFIQRTFNPYQLINYIDKLYKKAIELWEQKLEGSMRFKTGMQFTLYITPGREQECQALLARIEQALIDAQIKAGDIHPTDRKIGIYSSIRHPGRWWYHPAIGLETYNPDNVQDPFVFLQTLLHDTPQQELKFADEYTPEVLLRLLRNTDLLSPAQFNTLAIHKKVLIDYIQTLSSEERASVIKESLDKGTTLGKFFRVQRGLFMPKNSRGTLKMLQDMEARTNTVSSAIA